MRRNVPAHERQTQAILLYGHHAVRAALANPERPCRRLLVTENAARRLEAQVLRPELAVERVSVRELDRLLGEGVVHQGCCLEVEPLPERALGDMIASFPSAAL